MNIGGKVPAKDVDVKTCNERREKLNGKRENEDVRRNT